MNNYKYKQQDTWVSVDDIEFSEEDLYWSWNKVYSEPYVCFCINGNWYEASDVYQAPINPQPTLFKKYIVPQPPEEGGDR